MSMNSVTGRRDFIKKAVKTIGAVGFSLTGAPTFSFGQSETVKIGYLPITDAWLFAAGRFECS